MSAIYLLTVFFNLSNLFIIFIIYFYNLLNFYNLLFFILNGRDVLPDAAIVIVRAAAGGVLRPPVIDVPPHLGYGCPQ
jgi:hypothetical protein